MHPLSQTAPGPEVTVYSTDLDAVSADPDFLSDQERHRAEKFRFKLDRERYIAARTWLRRILGTALHYTPGSVLIEIDPFQKPFLPGFPLHFNLSHSGPYAAVALCRTHAVGIDLEQPLPPGEAMELQRIVCSETESLALKDSPDPDLMFLRIWTAKEALLKGLGTGFFTAPSSLTIHGNSCGGHADSTDPNLDLTDWKLITCPGPASSLITVAVPANAEVTFHSFCSGAEG